MPQGPRRTAQSGFTLVELVTVLVLVGILAAVAMPRFATGGFDGRAYSDQVKGLMRYGQKIAIAQGRNVFVRLNDTSVALCYDAACNARVPPASGNNSGSRATLAACGNLTSWACEGLPNGVTMTPAASTFSFDATGAPFAQADAVNAVTSTFATLAISVTGGGTAYPITVNAATGYVN
ncbi:prepilin-type N-terminal cleavage/methylation domain-containing protein [Duganella aceris]|uniref:Prepilin-type N-terminal cleavage/methylation domain-containing protein n=1 Tax=Duganella aceris TaxID=2703883 RepID=A0ABX0FJ68_9BURK|nr:prepilin-type N-terminal cleavage/methylation domain-containing protein [Duganella aceris]NGZ84597.1 prepilin-type N-terminal cleavage/methylation domain-containing protein [Duganella aceris]